MEPRLTRRVKPYEVYIRPHNYSLLIGTAQLCIVNNRIRRPVDSFVVQADLANAGIINIGDSSTSLTNGLQLDAGHAWLFSVSNPSGFPALLSQTPLEMNQIASVMQEQASIYAEYGRYNVKRVVMDMADFYAIADAADQRLRIFWTMLAE